MSTALLAYLFTTISIQHGLPPNLLSSLCYVESRHNISAIHVDDGSTNSVGVCQVKLKTAKWLGFQGTEKQLMAPEVNITYAAKYLTYQTKRYGSIKIAIIGYNKGNAKGLTSSAYQLKVLKQWRLNVGGKSIEKRYCEGRFVIDPKGGFRSRRTSAYGRRN